MTTQAASLIVPETDSESEFLRKSSPRRIHFVGIGGAGMSAIALVAHQKGLRVSGSDLKMSHYCRELTEAGVKIILAHFAQTIDRIKPDVIVSSTAIPETNPEIIRARELGIPVWPRAKMLSFLGRGKKTVAVAGTHGKTTTSSMIATTLDKLGMDPSFLIGGIVEGYGVNAREGSGELFVVEADESDGSFLFLDPSLIVVTNVESDHLDHYGTFENLERTFSRFMSSVHEGGTLLVCADNKEAILLAEASKKPYVSYGLSQDADYVCCPHPQKGELSSHFEVQTPDSRRVALKLSASPGVHNMLNATAAFAAASCLGADPENIAQALSQFKGARRRFTRVGECAGVTVVDDYGHHPTEIKATLAAARSLNYQRIVVVFQPHRYSRTEALAEEFTHAFDDADIVCLADIFSAGELPIPGVTSRALAQRIAKEHAGSVEYVPTRKEQLRYLAQTLRPQDLVLTMGAGDITLLGEEILKTLAQREKESSKSADSSQKTASEV